MTATEENSRRRFVIGGLATVAAGGLAGCGGGGAGSVVTPPDTGAAPAAPVLTATEADAWDALVGTAFLIGGEGGKASARLLSVERAPTDPNRPDLARRAGFTVHFQVEAGPLPLGERTYALSHASRGAFELFLGQPGEVMGKTVLSAVLN